MSGDLISEKVSGSFTNAELSTMSGALRLNGIESSAPTTDYNINTMSGESSVKMVMKINMYVYNYITICRSSFLEAVQETQCPEPLIFQAMLPFKNLELLADHSLVTTDQAHPR